MRARPHLHAALLLATLLPVIVPACSNKAPYDWKNREIAWTYGPTKGGATLEHLKGTGTKGPGPIAVGWKCRLSDGSKLEVKPYQLSKEHALFGKTKMTIGLFDKSGKKLESFRSEVITADNATSSFELQEAVAKSLWDVVIWYVKA